tara:strand:- start:570 stop:929 length:360 start_codon:yes stop_codon:yes gene_type:complete
MANPNIVNVTRILANTVTGAFVASNTVFHTNPASSGSVHKINSILVTNIDGTANADFDLIITNAGANSYMIKTVVVPADSAIVAVDKNSSFYLLENSKIGGAASAAGDLVYTISLEQIY